MEIRLNIRGRSICCKKVVIQGPEGSILGYHTSGSGNNSVEVVRLSFKPECIAIDYNAEGGIKMPEDDVGAVSENVLLPEEQSELDAESEEDNARR